MEILSGLYIGLGAALTPANLMYCLIGTLLGTLVGILPGLGPAVTIAILLPITFTQEPTSALIMLAGIYYGAQYGGSTTAILVNLPGEPSATVTAIDGYQMARKGRAGPALAIAAIGSFIAGTIATLVIVFFAPLLSKMALSFGSVEYFALIVVGLITAVALASGSLLKALLMAVLGLLLGTVGTDVATGESRFTFGVMALDDGIDIIAVAVGLFGLADILRNLEGDLTRKVTIKVGKLWPSRTDLKRSKNPILRGTMIGSVLGVLPGGGALLSTFASYAVEKKVAKNTQEFGHGAIEGVAGPEAANNASAQTSFIPMLTLGIPSNAVMALMVGAMVVQGIVPGPNIITKEPQLFWGLIVSMWFGNLMLLVLNLPLVGLWVKLLTIPYKYLFPAIILIASIGTYAVNSSSFDCYVIAAAGVIGYVLSRFKCEPTPLILGFVLGPLLESHLRRAMLLSRGDATVFLTSPISAVLLAIAAIMLVVVIMPSVSKKREEIFVEE